MVSSTGSRAGLNIQKAGDQYNLEHETASTVHGLALQEKELQSLEGLSGDLQLTRATFLAMQIRDSTVSNKV
jgi:hypothetical protein